VRGPIRAKFTIFGCHPLALSRRRLGLAAQSRSATSTQFQLADFVAYAVSRVLHRLVREESVAPADIVVLVSSSRTGPLKKDSVVRAFELTGDQAAEPGKACSNRSEDPKDLNARLSSSPESTTSRHRRTNRTSRRRQKRQSDRAE